VREAPPPAAAAAPEAIEAPRGATTAAPSAAPQAAAPSRSAGPPVNYVARLSAALSRAKSYPRLAQLRGIEGVVRITFTMRGDGTVTDWRIVRSSGEEMLDDEIGPMLRRASPLPAPPPEMGDPVSLTVDIDFNIRRR
jgi:protein TonB